MYQVARECGNWKYISLMKSIALNVFIINITAEKTAKPFGYNIQWSSSVCIAYSFFFN